MLKQHPSVTLSITVSNETLAGVRRSICACETCSRNAHVSFAQLLNRFVGPLSTECDYVFAEELQCPWCMSPIDADTLVELQAWKAAAAHAGN
jgi:hypothetical protein